MLILSNADRASASNFFRLRKGVPLVQIPHFAMLGKRCRHVAIVIQQRQQVRIDAGIPAAELDALDAVFRCDLEQALDIAEPRGRLGRLQPRRALALVVTVAALEVAGRGQRNTQIAPARNDVVPFISRDGIGWRIFEFEQDAPGEPRQVRGESETRRRRTMELAEWCEKRPRLECCPERFRPRGVRATGSSVEGPWLDVAYRAVATPAGRA